MRPADVAKNSGSSQKAPSASLSSFLLSPPILRKALLMLANVCV